MKFVEKEKVVGANVYERVLLGNIVVHATDVDG